MQCLAHVFDHALVKLPRGGHKRKHYPICENHRRDTHEVNHSHAEPPDALWRCVLRRISRSDPECERFGVFPGLPSRDWLVVEAPARRIQDLGFRI
jgi:hypothetical protein